MNLKSSPVSQYKVLHLVRSIGAVSMIWNELYYQGRQKTRGRFYPPVVIQFFGKTQFSDTPYKKGGYSRYACTSYMSAAFFLSRWIERINKNQVQKILLHVHNPVLAPIAVLIRLVKRDVQIVTTLHSDWKYMRFHQRIGLHLLALFSSRFITVSQAVQENFPLRVRRHLVRKGKVMAIPNGIPVKELAESARDSLPERKKERKGAIVVARMVSAKNCLFIIDLFKEVSEMGTLTWYGDGELRPVIERRIDELGLKSRVLLMGTQPREVVYKALTHSRIYLSASKWEGLGVANLEAVALGCYPLLSSIPAHNEIAENIGHFTLDVQKPDEWKHAIRNYLDLQRAEQEEMRERMICGVTRHYDIEAMIRSYLRVYQEVAMNEQACA